MDKATNNKNATLDYQAFEKKVPFRALLKFFLESKSLPIIIVYSFFSLVFILTGVVFVAFMIRIQALAFENNYELILFPAMITTVFVILFLSLIYKELSTAKKNYRIEKFSKANNFQTVFNDFPVSATRSGLIFNIGSSNKYKSVVVMGNITLGDYSYVTGSGKNRRIHRYLVGNIKLNRKFPHVVFDNKKNNFLSSNLPTFFNSDQKISLEGNFDDYFSTYVPENYQVDVLSYVTPELMEKLIEYCSLFDVEVVDDELYVYSLKRVDYKNDIREFSELLEELSYEFNDNAKHYRDDRVVAFGANAAERASTISSEGKRLKKSFTPILLTAAVFFLITMVNMFIQNSRPQVGVLGGFIALSLIIGVFRKIKSRR